MFPNKMLLLATLLAALALHSANAYQKYPTVIAVYNTTGESDIVNCSIGANYRYNINELPLDNITSGTLLRLCSKYFILRKNLSLSNLENIALVGYESPTVKCENEINVSSNLGIVLGNIHNLELHNFTVDGCGVMTTIDSKADHNIKSGVVIQYTTNITVTGVNITKSPGTGLALFYNNGSVKFESSVFDYNGMDKQTGGNGIYMETGRSISIVRSGLVAEYSFENCDFLFNTAATGKDNVISGFSRFDKGGGLCVYILASEKHEVTISNSHFIGNQAGHYGGGLFVSYNGKAKDNNVRVVNCEFSMNNATFGGGTYGGYLHTRLPALETPLNCSHIYESLNFTENSAVFGGGCSVFSSKTLSRDSNAHVNFVNCTWMRNAGQYGAAVTVLPNAWNLYTEGYLPTPRFIGCTISSNYVKSRTMFKKGAYAEYSKGSGAFYCFGHNVSFEKQTLIESNQGSAMYLGSCLAIFYENSITYFVNNTGYQGGAIYILSSVVYVQDNSTLYFSANKAEDKGGAIYEHTFFMHIYEYSKTCFIDYVDDFTEVTERNISVTFIANFAGKYGHSIYTSSLRPCYNRFSFSAANLSVDIFDQVGNFTYFPENRPMEIATAINHSNITIENWSENLLFIPGKRIRLPFVDVDDLNQTVRTSYLVTIQNGSNVTVSQDYTDISSNMLLLYGEGNSIVTLSDTSSRQIALTFDITMQACPPGFIQDDGSEGCVCSAGLNESYFGIKHCNVSGMRAYSQYGYWIGYMENKTENEESLISAYYNPTENFSDPTGNGRLLPETADRKDLNAIMCDETRTGFLCSQCKENMTVHYHSQEFACKSNKYCTIGWLFYILSELVPVTIIFIVIIYFNISFTSGLVNGFIFYCQMVEVIQLVSNGFISVSETARIINKVHTFVYLSTTLNLFFLEELSFCLWDNASAMSIAAFSNVTLLYALVLVVLVTVVFRSCSFRCTCRRKSSGYFPLAPNPKFQGSIIHGLAAFLILCYAHCGHSSLPLLLSVSVYSKGPTAYQTRVYVQPDIEWLSADHLPFATLSLLLVFFMLFLPPILLVVYPLHYKVLAFFRIAEFRCVQIVFSPLDKLKPFFDSFQSCFKDKFRFFSGLYFIYRLSMIVIVFSHSAQVSFFFIEVQLVVMLTLHALCQPYKEHLHNVIDTLLFCNLAVINAITYYNVSASIANVTDLNLTVTTWLQTLLIILPLLVVLVFLFAHTPCVRACRRRKSSSIRDPTEEDDLPDRMQVNYYQAPDN